MDLLRPVTHTDDSTVANEMGSGASKARPLICIVGPTAVGKSKIGVELAKRIGGEIISADSMQVYRGMDIGTAKVTSQEMQNIPHYCIDIVDANQSFTVADYREYATRALETVYVHKRTPILVGGTGLYVQSITHTMTFTQVGEDKEIREQLWEQAGMEQGSLQLFQKLQAVDPDTAEKLHPNDSRRIIRALEVYHLTGMPMSKQYGNHGKNEKYRTVMFGLNRKREDLYAHIDERVNQMVETGLVEEVKHLLENNITPLYTSMQAIGYKEIVAYLIGEYSLDEAIFAIKQGSRRYAKRQLSWFRRFPEIIWYDVDEEGMEQILQKMVTIVEGIL